MNLSVYVDCGHQEAPKPEAFETWVATALSGYHSRWCPTDIAEVSIQVVDSEEMKRFNYQYRGKETDTNVLSFHVDAELQKQTGLLGDLIICSDVVQREANEQSKTPEHHWAHMTIHGTLHLLGYDHIADDDAELMEALEVACLAHLSISNPYNQTENLT